MIDPPRCPITYELLAPGERYSKKGLLMLSPKLTTLHDLPYKTQELLVEATQRADKLSIQGVQPKLSAKLNIKQQCFELTDKDARFILKPQHPQYPHLPENEDLTMKLAACVKLKVPVHGMVWGSDEQLTYFIRRFDRVGRNQKKAMEDFAQLMSLKRDIKYNASMEKVASVIEKYCTFPQLEKATLFTLTVFSYLIGNEDMHIKNFSLIDDEGVWRLSPAYDLVNSTLVLGKAKEELALPLKGKKSNLTKNDIINYFGKERLGIADGLIKKTLHRFVEAWPQWQLLISISFLPDSLKQRYLEIVAERYQRLF